MTQQQEEWKKEFDEHFMKTDVYPNDLIPTNDVLATHHLIKGFISTLLAKREKAVREEIKNILFDGEEIQETEGSLVFFNNEKLQKIYFLVQDTQKGSI